MWAGHIFRQNETRWTWRVAQWRLRLQKKTIGRPPKRWMDDIKRSRQNGRHLEMPMPRSRQLTAVRKKTSQRHWIRKVTSWYTFAKMVKSSSLKIAIKTSWIIRTDSDLSRSITLFPSNTNAINVPTAKSVRACLSEQSKMRF